MLKKNSRNIRMMGIQLEFSARRRKVKILPDIKECLLIIQNHLQSSGILTEKYQNERVTIGLRKLAFSENQEVATLLWAGGDSDVVDPSFWNPQNDTTRTEAAVEGEKVSYSCHMVIYLTRTDVNNGCYIAAKEEVPILSLGLINKFFNSLLRKYTQYQLKDEDDTAYKAYPLAKIDTLASKTLRDALVGKTPFQVEAVCVEKAQKAFDENFNQKKVAKRLTIVPSPESILGSFTENFKSLLPKLKEYTEVYIRYKDETKKVGSLLFEIDELSSNDLDTYLLAQKLNLCLDQGIGQFCDEIHQELKNKMSIHVVCEHQRLAMSTH